MRVLSGGKEAGRVSALVEARDLQLRSGDKIRASDFPSVKSGTEVFFGHHTNWKNPDFAQKLARPAGLEPATF